ncbi:hypothetical protein TVAG_477540 [Trichomonas vaginalis G3]|uniref:Uncharacterized protein n=1 Tax=Trichomonas vaginalis (strain ATCC PRA-98 / G3) TaxID=412133 RepID=A2F9G1_TRIV3|nr:armadillo (ARM) repeat-containing protein family [Trichomonas vaginalis G3]EAX98480.1 hypothetical protein TVAG_477540 [Trichomonas vaginalis G3]KAI5492763.1 armadillo (ARM) repeat-containing protein family [Trichomonas vaginalis G3]|eukprot:XP_001311410.1 hypothetical protein [Trichomonas vaginalis G3]
MDSYFLTKMRHQNKLLNIENRSEVNEQSKAYYIHQALKTENVSDFERYISCYNTEKTNGKSSAEFFQQNLFERLFDFLLSNQNQNLPKTAYKFIKNTLKQVKFDANLFKILENNQHYFSKMREYLVGIGEAASSDPLAIGICKIISCIAQYSEIMNQFIIELFPLELIYNTMGQNPACISFYLYSVSKCNLQQDVFEFTVSILRQVQNLSEKWINKLLDTITLYIRPDIYKEVQDHVEFINLFIIGFLRDPFYDSACRLAKELFSMFNQVPEITCNEKFDIEELIKPIFDRIYSILNIPTPEAIEKTEEDEKFQKVTEKFGKQKPKKVTKVIKPKVTQKVKVPDPIPPLEALHEIIFFVKSFPDEFVDSYLKLFTSTGMHGLKQLIVKEIYVRLIAIIVSFSPDKIELVLQCPELMQYFSNLLESDQPEYALELFCLIQDYFKQQSRNEDLETLANNLVDYRELISDCINSQDPKIREFATQLDSLFTQE